MHEYDRLSQFCTSYARDVLCPCFWRLPDPLTDRQINHGSISYVVVPAQRGAADVARKQHSRRTRLILTASASKQVPRFLVQALLPSGKARVMLSMAFGCADSQPQHPCGVVRRVRPILVRPFVMPDRPFVGSDIKIPLCCEMKSFCHRTGPHFGVLWCGLNSSFINAVRACYTARTRENDVMEITLEQFNQRFREIDQRFEKIDRRFEKLEQGQEKLEQNQQRLGKGVAEVKQAVCTYNTGVRIPVYTQRILKELVLARAGMRPLTSGRPHIPVHVL